MKDPTLDNSAPPGPREALPSICTALGLGGRTQEAVDLFAAMTEPHHEGALALAVGAEPEVRFIVDAQAEEPSPSARWAAARALTRRLAERYALTLEPVARVEDLFEPTAGMASRHVAVLRANAPPRFEVWFDARAQGRWRARAIVEESLVRLGLGHAWPDVAERVLRRGPYLDDLEYVSIALSSAGDARGSSGAVVELYVRHHDATAEDLRAALDGSPLAARAGELSLAMTGSPGPYRARPLVSCHAFGETGARGPASRALRVPVAAYAPTDAVTRGRVSGYLALLGFPYEGYEAALAACARPPLAARAGLQSYVGLRDDPGALSVTVDFSPQGRAAPAPDAAAGEGISRPSTEEIVRRFENDIVLADHPFLRRLAREPVQLGPLWLMLANFWEGIVHDFPKRLSHVIAKTDDDRIRCVLTKQLNDELGEGVYERAHKRMFQTLLEAVAPYRLPGPDDVLLAPGRAFGQELGAMMFSDDPHEAVGAMMMIEIYGKQTDLFMGSQFRRQDRLDSAALLWLHLHEGLEVDHAEDSLSLARCVPSEPAAIAAAWRGAEAIVTAGRHYFDAFYRICFG
jgi:Iron-containing redox enzyme